MIEADANLFLYLNQLFAAPMAAAFFKTITHLGNGWWQLFLVAPVMLIFSRTKFRTHIVAMVLSVMLGGGLVNVAKVIIDRPRPPEYFASRDVEVHTPGRLPSSRSFPSGHTQTAFGTATYLSCLYPALSPVFFLLALAVGISRIALGVHFPLDVLVGAMVGSGIALLGYRLNIYRMNRRNPV